MRKINEIKSLIEKKREELDALILTDKFETYYEKSKELDKLIEEYLDVEEITLANAQKIKYEQQDVQF